MGYCENKRGFRVYNQRTLIINETIHITFDESNSDIFKSCGEDNDAGVQEELKKLTITDQGTTSSENDSQEDESQDSPTLKDNDRNVSTPSDLPRAWKFIQNHLKELIIGDPSEKVRTRSFFK